jgi:Rnl2 family RNA ligase
MNASDNNSQNWNYISYEKIPETLNKLQLTEAEYRIFKKTDWVVTEKIHGSNFGIVTDGMQVRFGKRKEFLQPEEVFFGYQSFQDKLVLPSQEIFRILKAQRPHLAKVYIYGELFGGDYPHPDVPSVNHVQAVQTGVYYSPKIEYCAFDIAVIEEGNAAEILYLDYDKSLTLLQQVEMMSAQPLFIGKYEEALAYNIEFESTIPATLGLPKLPLVNKAEGVVIKPIKAIYINTRQGRIRPIIKRKIPEFAEDSRFHQAQKWNYQPQSTPTVNTSLEAELTQEMLLLVTPTRLNNVISKIGRVASFDQKQQQLVELLLLDVLDSFQEEYESIFTALLLETQQMMMERLHQEVQSLVNAYCQG